MSDLRGEGLVDGVWQTGSGAGFTALDPLSGMVLQPEYRAFSAAQVSKACAGAEAAFGVYRRHSGKQRAHFLRAIAAQLEALGDSLLARAQAETSLPMPRLLSERARTVGQLRMFAELLEEGSWVDACIEHGLPTRMPAPKPDLRRMRIALGPVAVFGASNFPLAFSVAGGDTASALAAGCSVVVKAHPAHPGCSELAARAVHAAAIACGLPGSILSLVHGPDPDVGLALVCAPEIRAVGFTGSLTGGRALFDAAAARAVPIPVFAEMGSANPVFVLPEALAERGEEIARQIAQAGLQANGQFCTSPGLTFVTGGSGVEDFTAAAARVYGSAEPGVFVHPKLRGPYDSAVSALTRIPGVNCQARGRSQGGPAAATAALFVTEADCWIEADRLHEEVYGPATTIVHCDERQLLAIARKLHGHLTATVHGTPQDLAKHRELLEVLTTKVGRLIWNGVPTGVEVCAAMHHGGPYPASTDSRSTSVGSAAIERFTRPICFQNMPQGELPLELRDDNPLAIWRLVNGQRVR